jgi:hypothetical protein
MASKKELSSQTNTPIDIAEKRTVNPPPTIQQEERTQHQEEKSIGDSNADESVGDQPKKLKKSVFCV